MAYRIGATKGSTSGRTTVARASAESRAAPFASDRKITRPPRAITSSRFEAVFSNRESEGAITITGTSSSISAMGPCFISPAA